MKKIKYFSISILAIGLLYLFFHRASDQRIVESLHGLIPTIERMGLTAYRNQDWCQVVAYDGKAFSNTDQATCVFVTDLKTSRFSPEASLKLKEISNLLSPAKIRVRSLENIKFISGQLAAIEFHEDCRCRTRYVFSPGYRALPSDIPNEVWHFAIDNNWYRVEEDWN